MSQPSPLQRRLLLLVPLLSAVGVAATVMLAWEQVLLLRAGLSAEQACGAARLVDCAAWEASPWAFWRNAPLLAQLVPWQGILAWLAMAGQLDNERGAAARRFHAVVAGLLFFATVGLWVNLGVAGGGLPVGVGGLVSLHGAIALLAWQDRSSWRPGLPAIEERVAGMLIWLMGAGLAVQLLVILGDRQERIRDEGLVARIQAPLTAVVVTQPEEVGRMAIPPRRDEVPTDRFDPYVGDRQAEVTVVVFADMVHPDARLTTLALAELRAGAGEGYRILYKMTPTNAECRSNPRRSSESSCVLARAAICAGRQGLFWEFIDEMARSRASSEAPVLAGMAAGAGLEPNRFRDCLSEPSPGVDVEEDLSHAAFLGLTGPSHVFVAGHELVGEVSAAQVRALTAWRRGELQPGEDGLLPLREEVVTDPAVQGPANMVRWDRDGHRFRIDAVEYSQGEGGLAPVGGAQPAVVGATEAEAACAARGLKLCELEQWTAVCEGRWPGGQDGPLGRSGPMIRARAFPYGPQWRPGYCNDGAGGADQLRPAGGSPGCRSPEGVYDLVGNQPEWVRSGDRLVLAGGGVQDRGFASCRRVVEGEQGGLRCCE